MLIFALDVNAKQDIVCSIFIKIIERCKSLYIPRHTTRISRFSCGNICG